MSKDINEDFYSFGKFIRSLLKPFPIYLFFIILIVMFPPIERRYSNFFLGWSFITDLGGDHRINMIYFLSEIGIVTLVYFAYLFSKKK